MQPELPIGEGEGSARQKLDRMRADGIRYHLVRTERLGLTTAALAEILGISKRAIQQREAGQVSIRQEHWMALESVNLTIQRRKIERIMSTAPKDLEFVS